MYRLVFVGPSKYLSSTYNSILVNIQFTFKISSNDIGVLDAIGCYTDPILDSFLIQVSKTRLHFHSQVLKDH